MGPAAPRLERLRAWVAWQDTAACCLAAGQRQVRTAPARQRQRKHCQCRTLVCQLQGTLRPQSAQTELRQPEQQAPQPSPALQLLLAVLLHRTPAVPESLQITLGLEASLRGRVPRPGRRPATAHARARLASATRSAAGLSRPRLHGASPQRPLLLSRGARWPRCMCEGE